jgi:branched-chain amino acid aminotransferase
MEIKAYKLSKNKIHQLANQASTLDELTKKWPRGFYTTFNTLEGGSKVLGLRAHLKRLYMPAKDAGISPAVSAMDLCRFLSRVTSENAPGETRVRLVMSKKDGTIYIGAHPFEPLPTKVYEVGVHVVTTSLTRHDPAIKDSGFIFESAKQRMLVGKDVFEVLLTKNNKIYEGMTSNFYAVKDGCIITARYGILPGVTRKNVLNLAKNLSLPINYHSPRLGEAFDEAFLTSSSRGIVPIVSIDGMVVGEGRVGPLAKKLLKAYQLYVQERSESLLKVIR